MGLTFFRPPESRELTFWEPVIILARTLLTFNFQGQIWNLLYLSRKWSGYHETKGKHIDLTQGFKCDNQVWPWPRPWIFKVKYGICYIPSKSGKIATKQKANIWIELQASNVTNGFDLGCDLDIWIWPWPRIFTVKLWNSSISEWEGQLRQK